MSSWLEGGWRRQPAAQPGGVRQPWQSPGSTDHIPLGHWQGDAYAAVDPYSWWGGDWNAHGAAISAYNADMAGWFGDGAWPAVPQGVASAQEEQTAVPSHDTYRLLQQRAAHAQLEHSAYAAAADAAAAAAADAAAKLAAATAAVNVVAASAAGTNVGGNTALPIDAPILATPAPAASTTKTSTRISLFGALGGEDGDGSVVDAHQHIKARATVAQRPPPQEKTQRKRAELDFARFALAPLGVLDGTVASAEYGEGDAAVAASATPASWIELVRHHTRTRKEVEFIVEKVVASQCIEKPEHVTILVSALGRRQSWERAVDLLQQTESLFGPNEISYGAAISACAKVGRWQNAIGLLEEMPRRSLTPDAISYNLAIKACAVAAQWQRGLSFLEELLRKNVEVSDLSYSHTIGVCQKSQQWQQALAILGKIPPDRLDKVDAVTQAWSAGDRWPKVMGRSRSAKAEKARFLRTWSAGAQPPEESIMRKPWEYGPQGPQAQRICFDFSSDAVSHNIPASGNSSTSYNFPVPTDPLGRENIFDMSGAIEVDPTAQADPANCGFSDPYGEAFEEESISESPGRESYEVQQRELNASCSLEVPQWEHALLLLETASNQPSEEQLNMGEKYGHAITACAHARQWEHALRLLEGMLEQSFEPDAPSYDAVIGAVEANGSSDDLADNQECLLDLIEARHAAMMTATL